LHSSCMPGASVGGNSTKSLGVNDFLVSRDFQ